LLGNTSEKNGIYGWGEQKAVAVCEELRGTVMGSFNTEYDNSRETKTDESVGG